MSDRPGVMFYFSDWTPLLSLDDGTLAKLFRASIEYAQHGVIPEFEGTAAILWGLIYPKLDRDGERYQSRKDSGAYAAYCRDEKRAGRDPVSFEQWRIDRDRALSNDNDDNQLQQHLQDHSQSQPQMQDQPQTQFQRQHQPQGDARGKPYTPPTEGEFEDLRAEKLRLLESKGGE